MGFEQDATVTVTACRPGVWSGGNVLCPFESVISYCTARKQTINQPL